MRVWTNIVLLHLQFRECDADLQKVYSLPRTQCEQGLLEMSL